MYKYPDVLDMSQLFYGNGSYHSTNNLTGYGNGYLCGFAINSGSGNGFGHNHADTIGGYTTLKGKYIIYAFDEPKYPFNLIIKTNLNELFETVILK
jgi:hypothetical protein